MTDALTSTYSRVYHYHPTEHTGSIDLIHPIKTPTSSRRLRFLLPTLQRAQRLRFHYILSNTYIHSFIHGQSVHSFISTKLDGEKNRGPTNHNEKMRLIFLPISLPVLALGQVTGFRSTGNFVPIPPAEEVLLP